MSPYHELHELQGSKEEIQQVTREVEEAMEVKLMYAYCISYEGVNFFFLITIFAAEIGMMFNSVMIAQGSYFC